MMKRLNGSNRRLQCSGRLSLILIAALAGGCNGSMNSITGPTAPPVQQPVVPGPAPSPVPGPVDPSPKLPGPVDPPVSVVLKGRITETVPTSLTEVAGALITIADGPDAGRTAVASTFGYYTLSGLAPGAFTINVTADGFIDASKRVEIDRDATVDVQLMPKPETEMHTVYGDLGPRDGTCSDGTSERPCQIVVIPIHHSGLVEATLSWTEDVSASLGMAIFQTGQSTLLAHTASPAKNGELVDLTVPGGATYEFRILYYSGTDRAKYTLYFTNPN